MLKEYNLCLILEGRTGSTQDIGRYIEPILVRKENLIRRFRGGIYSTAEAALE